MEFAECDIVRGLHYLLIRNNVKRLQRHFRRHFLSKDRLLYVLRALCAVEPALLRKFFEIGFPNDEVMDEAFDRAAPVAMHIDPMLRVALVAIAKKNKWAKPVAGTIVDEDLVDDKDAGGTVHMQPLQPVA